MTCRRAQYHVVFFEQFLRRKLWFGIDVQLKKFRHVADRLGENERIALGDHRDRLRAETLQQRHAFRIACDIDRFVFYILGRKKLFRFQAAASSRAPKDANDIVHRILHMSEVT